MPHFRLHLSYVSIMFIVMKLKLANYYPVSGHVVYLAVKPGSSFDSHLNMTPTDQQIVLLKHEHIYIGERYFEVVFAWGWWLIPSILLASAVFAYWRARR